MKYEIMWHDYEDDRSGNPIKIEAESPKEAFLKAGNELDMIIGKSNMHFIEALIDEKGNHYNPDFNLPNETALKISNYDECKKELKQIQDDLKNGENITQETLNKLIEKWKNIINPTDKDKEMFVLVDTKGRNTNFTSPRWLCHLFGLRHRCSHIILKWSSPKLGSVYVFQIRSWDKSDSPGHLDISIGGHVEGNDTPEQTAYKEMGEELSLNKEDIEGQRLHCLGGYASYNENDETLFYNAEWRDVFEGKISSLDAIKFKDNEVVGLYLCPITEAERLLKQKLFPIASALQLSLPKCLNR